LPAAGGGTEIVRAYTIASHPEDVPAIEIVWNLVPNGQGSHYLFGLNVGDTLRFTGPWGTFTLDQAPAAECVFIAEATAIAPIRPMLRRALDTGSGYAVRLTTRTARGFCSTTRVSGRHTALPVVRCEPLGSICSRHRARCVAGDDDRTRHFYVCAVGPRAPAARLLRGTQARRAVREVVTRPLAP
jgi:ferredoxin-NADP reductase